MGEGSAPAEIKQIFQSANQQVKVISLLLMGSSHKILLSEMSLPGVEVPVEKLLLKVLGRLGKENPCKRR